MPRLQDLFNAGWIKVAHEFIPHYLRVFLIREGHEMEVLVQDGKIVECTGGIDDLVLVRPTF